MIDLSMIAYWNIRARLLRVPGVANVAIWGERIKMLQVQVDPERLRAHDVTLEEVMETTADALDCGLFLFQTARPSAPAGSSTPRIKGSSIRTSPPIVTPEDLAQVPIKVRGRRAARCWAMWPT